MGPTKNNGGFFRVFGNQFGADAEDREVAAIPIALANALEEKRVRTAKLKVWVADCRRQRSY